MRRPTVEGEQDDSAFEEMAQYSHGADESVESGICTAGQSCTGCFSGVLLAYMALLLFNNSVVVIAMMSLGVSFGLTGSITEDPRDINRLQLAIHWIVSCGIASAVSLVTYWTDDLLCIIGVSILSATILNSCNFLFKISNLDKVAAVKPDTYKKCSV